MPATEQARIGVKEIGQIVKAWVMERSPAVLSLGRRCVEDGFDFVWRRRSRVPYYITEDHRIIRLETKGHIPYLRPGAELCQPIEPNDEFPLLPGTEPTSGVCQDGGVSLSSVAIQTDEVEAEIVHVSTPGPVLEELEEDTEQDGKWSEDRQVQIVSPPAPQKEAKLRRMATTVPHILVHKPMNSILLNL